jgi:hypothetical protein
MLDHLPSASMNTLLCVAHSMEEPPVFWTWRKRMWREAVGEVSHFLQHPSPQLWSVQNGPLVVLYSGSSHAGGCGGPRLGKAGSGGGRGGGIGGTVGDGGGGGGGSAGGVGLGGGMGERAGNGTCGGKRWF